MAKDDDHKPDEGLEDAADMARARAGDETAFAGIVRRRQASLVNFFGRLGAYSYAEDLAQETLVRVFKYRDRYRPTARFSTFLFTVARHVWYDALRKRKRIEAGMARLQRNEELRNSERRGPREDRIDAVRRAVEELPEKLRLIVVLSVYEGLDYEATGRAAGIPVGTVKSRMHAAVRRLKEALGESDA